MGPGDETNEKGNLKEERLLVHDSVEIICKGLKLVFKLVVAFLIKISKSISPREDIMNHLSYKTH